MRVLVSAYFRGIGLGAMQCCIVVNLSKDKPMSNTTKIVRDISSANERTKLYFRLLTRKTGVSVAEMRKEVLSRIDARRGEAYTPHNSYSLQLLADTYGQKFCSIQEENGEMRYYFRSAKNAETFDEYYPEFKRKCDKLIRNKRIAEAQAEAEAKAKAEARKAKAEAKAQALKASSKARKAEIVAPQAEIVQSGSIA